MTATSIVKVTTGFVVGAIRGFVKTVCRDIVEDAVSGVVDRSDIKEVVYETKAWKKIEDAKEKARLKIKKMLGKEEKEEDEKEK